MGYLLAVLLGQLVRLDVLRDRGGRLPEPVGPCTDPDPLPFIGSNLQGAGPGEASLFRDGSSVFLLYNPFKANDPGPVIPRPVVMVRLGFTPKGPYLAAG